LFQPGKFVLLTPDRVSVATGLITIEIDEDFRERR
jgi:hypothetical protein